MLGEKGTVLQGATSPVGGAGLEGALPGLEAVSEQSLGGRRLAAQAHAGPANNTQYQEVSLPSTVHALFSPKPLLSLKL